MTTAPSPAPTPEVPTASVGAPPLPRGRGPVSTALLEALDGRAPTASLPGHVSTAQDSEPYGDDVQLALYLCYELHYRGFAGVDPELEWDPDVLRLRRALEERFLRALRADTAGGADVDAAIEELLVEPVEGDGPSHRLAREGSAWQVREYVAHRSLYHLKEADPQTWAIPRLEGEAKAALTTVQHDEYGAGRAENVHARLFAEMMDDLGVDSTYGRHLDAAPAVTLATVNVMSLFGLHRRWRGALVGQFALVEITSSPGSARLVSAIRAAGLGERATRFYAEHVEADAVHEQLVRRGVLAGLLDREPNLAADVVFGLQSAALTEDRLADHLVRSWSAGESSLRD